MNNIKSNGVKRYQEGDSLFDGFAHRPYVESIDGWRNVIPDPSDYPCVRQANDVLDMFEELTAARSYIWKLEKEIAMLKPLLTAYL